MIIDHPTDTACHYDEEFELRCTAKSRSGKDLIFQWMAGKFFWLQQLLRLCHFLLSLFHSLPFSHSLTHYNDFIGNSRCLKEDPIGSSQGTSVQKMSASGEEHIMNIHCRVSVDGSNWINSNKAKVEIQYGRLPAFLCACTCLLTIANAHVNRLSLFYNCTPLT